MDASGPSSGTSGGGGGSSERSRREIAAPSASSGGSASGGGGGGSSSGVGTSVVASLAAAPPPELETEDKKDKEPRPETAVDKKEIHTCDLPWAAYGLAASNLKSTDATGSSGTSKSGFRYAVGSFVEDYCNKVRIIQLDEETAEFKTRAQFDHPYPATRIQWAPREMAKRKDLLATTGDYLRLWEVQEDDGSGDTPVRMVTLLNNSKTAEYCAPLTSFDWNPLAHERIATSSIDTTVAVWDVEREKVSKLLQAHDKEVYDVAWARHREIFATVGADGSMRLFDLRALDYSTIVCETPGLVPMLRAQWNHLDTNFLSAVGMDRTWVAIIDIRLPSTPVAMLKAHSASVNAVAWAPHSPCHVISAGDDSQALIWDLAPQPKDVEDPILAYTADAEINNIIWPSANPEWVVITYGKNLQVLRV